MFQIGIEPNNKVFLDNLSYERDVIGEYYDDNWMRGRVAVHGGAFSGQYQACFQTTDFLSFLSELNTLYETLKGSAKFETLEGQLSILATGNGRGQIGIEVIAIDTPGMGAVLKTVFEIDQTELLTSIRQLKKLVVEFPVRNAE